MRMPLPARLLNNTTYFAARAVSRLPFGWFGAWWLGLVFGYVGVVYGFLGFGFGAALMYERVMVEDRKALYTFFGVIE